MDIGQSFSLSLSGEMLTCGSAIQSIVCNVFCKRNQRRADVWRDRNGFTNKQMSSGQQGLHCKSADFAEELSNCSNCFISCNKGDVSFVAMKVH